MNSKIGGLFAAKPSLIGVLVGLALFITACESAPTPAAAPNPTVDLQPTVDALVNQRLTEKERQATIDAEVNLRVSQIADTTPTATPRPTASPNHTLPPIPTRPTSEIVSRARPSIVRIETPEGMGSGTIITSDGYVLTNWHVVAGNSSVNVLVQDKSYYTGRVLGYNEALDLAVLKIGGGPWPFLSISKTRPQAGSEIIVIGYPRADVLQGEARVTKGIASGFEEIQGISRVQTDASINPGNSGGVALNTEGDFIGVPTWVLQEGENIGFFTGFFNTADEISKLIAGEKVGGLESSPVTTITTNESVRNTTYGYSLIVPEGWSLIRESDDEWTLGPYDRSAWFIISGFPSTASINDFHSQISLGMMNEYITTNDISTVNIESTEWITVSGLQTLSAGFTGKYGGMSVIGVVRSFVVNRNHFSLFLVMSELNSEGFPITNIETIHTSFFESLQSGNTSGIVITPPPTAIHVPTATPDSSALAIASPSFGKYYRGMTLDLSIVSLERVQELRYATIDTNQVTHHYQVTPSSDDLELVLLRLKVENHTATSAIVNIDSQAADLRDFLRGSYRPININDRVEEVSAPENPGQERSIVFLWNQTFEDGTSKAFELKKDFGLDGWMVFEAPKDNKFRELRWRAGDSLTIDF